MAVARPEAVENPSFEKVIELVKAYRDWFESDDYYEDGIKNKKHEIAWAAISAVMGPGFGDWVSEQMDRERPEE